MSHIHFFMSEVEVICSHDDVGLDYFLIFLHFLLFNLSFMCSELHSIFMVVESY